MHESNQYALLIGPCEGAGYEVASALAAGGHHLIIVSKEEKELDVAAYELRNGAGVDVRTIANKLLSDADVRELADDIQDQGVEVRLLIDHSGYSLPMDPSTNVLYDELVKRQSGFFPA